jgi:Kef-type K+ transport system membrane component KefB
MLRSEKVKFASAILVLTIAGTLMLGSTATLSAQNDYVPSAPSGRPMWVWVAIGVVIILIIIGILGWLLRTPSQ